ncbi:MAG: DNA polymerase III subunit epsilon [Flavobacteriaceae bacterium]|nr:DNA polymerase III subunit epsilon [Flavobacteriaceae bacterium]
MYTVVDIETTGGEFNEEGITEIAIFKFDGNNVIDTFISLINPEKEIQPFVVNLTGINNKMLINAPKFYEVAKRILEITENTILIAHNASFDYRVIQTEFSRLGYNFKRETLCTVQLSKKIFPNLPKYKLGALCHSLGIPIYNRHRAEGDAFATVKLFEQLLHKDVAKEIIIKAIKPISTKLSDRLLQILTDLPSKTGLFYFYNNEGKILYINKSKNIKKTINNLFLREVKKIKNLVSKTENISFDLLGNDLMCDLKLHKELKLHQPRYNQNRKQKLNLNNFSNANMLIIDNGRHNAEQSVILIENNTYIGNTFVDLNYQINNIKILRSLVNLEINDNHNNFLIKNYLQKNKVKRIIRF